MTEVTGLDVLSTTLQAGGTADLCAHGRRGTRPQGLLSMEEVRGWGGPALPCCCSCGDAGCSSALAPRPWHPQGSCCRRAASSLRCSRGDARLQPLSGIYF